MNVFNHKVGYIYFQGDDKWYPSPQVMNQSGDLLNISQPYQDDKNVWLFDILQDPFERLDLSDKYPDVVQTMLERLTYNNSTAVHGLIDIMTWSGLCWRDSRIITLQLYMVW